MLTAPAILEIRACFENGWRGRPARPGRRPADQNCCEQRCEKAVPIGSNCRPRSVRRVAGQHRRVACATSKPFFKHALRTWDGFKKGEGTASSPLFVAVTKFHGDGPRPVPLAFHDFTVH